MPVVFLVVKDKAFPPTTIAKKKKKLKNFEVGFKALPLFKMGNICVSVYV